MNVSEDPEFLEHVYLRANGYFPREIERMTAQRRADTIKALMRIKEMEVARLVAALAKGLF